MYKYLVTEFKSNSTIVNLINIFSDAMLTALGTGIWAQAQVPAEDDEQPQHLTNDGK